MFTHSIHHTGGDVFPPLARVPSYKQHSKVLEPFAAEISQVGGFKKKRSITYACFSVSTSFCLNLLCTYPLCISETLTISACFDHRSLSIIPYTHPFTPSHISTIQLVDHGCLCVFFRLDFWRIYST